MRFYRIYISIRNTQTHINRSTHKKCINFKWNILHARFIKCLKIARSLPHRFRLCVCVCIMFDLYLSWVEEEAILMCVQHSWWKPILKMANALALASFFLEIGCCMFLLLCLYCYSCCYCCCCSFSFRKQPSRQIYNMYRRGKCETIYI